jgi:hypothetical protein
MILKIIFMWISHFGGKFTEFLYNLNVNIDRCTCLGVFFNGRKFVNFDGTKSDHHPHLELFIEEFLAAQQVQ